MANRIDEVAPKYVPAYHLDTVCGVLFYVLAILSLCVLFPSWFSGTMESVLKYSFVLLGVVLAVCSLALKLWLIPIAMGVRRKQLLSDSFGTVLTPERTVLYYNNGFDPSLQRLAANVMENALFGNEVARKMLVWVRIKTGGYAIMWIGFLCFRNTSIDVILWITQFVFSAEILTHWLNLEFLRCRHKRVFEDLHRHFHHEHGQERPQESASILDGFAEYESAKAGAGVLLSTRIFSKCNEQLSQEWADIRAKLKIPAPVENS